MEDVVKQIQTAHDRITTKEATVNKDLPFELVDLAQELVYYVEPTARILDIGNGHVRDMVWYESRGMTVVGIDLSFGMLSQASRLVSSNLCLMDMRRLAFREAKFQGVWCECFAPSLTKVRGF